MKLYFIAIVLILVSCNGQKKAVMDDKKEVASAASENQLELLMSEAQGGFETDELLVIRDAKRLKSFFSKINRTRKPGLPVPEIDFSKDMLIIQCIGEENHANNNIFSSVEETPTQMILKTQDSEKSENDTSAASASSFCVYKMPLTQKEVMLENSIKK